VSAERARCSESDIRCAWNVFLSSLPICINIGLPYVTKMINYISRLLYDVSDNDICCTVPNTLRLH